MLLIRKDKSFTADPENPNDYSQREYGFDKIEDRDAEMSKVRVDFPDFGRTEKRRPGFAVEVDWIDVRRYLAAFIEMEHPEALYIKRLIKLAEAIEDAGWSPDDPPTKEFFDAVSDGSSPSGSLGTGPIPQGNLRKLTPILTLKIPIKSALLLFDFPVQSEPA